MTGWQAFQTATIKGMKGRRLEIQIGVKAPLAHLSAEDNHRNHADAGQTPSSMPPTTASPTAAAPINSTAPAPIRRTNSPIGTLCFLNLVSIKDLLDYLNSLAINHSHLTPNPLPSESPSGAGSSAGLLDHFSSSYSCPSAIRPARYATRSGWCPLATTTSAASTSAASASRALYSLVGTAGDHFEQAQPAQGPGVFLNQSLAGSVLQGRAAGPAVPVPPVEPPVADRAGFLFQESPDGHVQSGTTAQAVKHQAPRLLSCRGPGHGRPGPQG